MLWPLSEISLAIVRRASRDAARLQDRGSVRILWLAIIASVSAGALLANFPHARIAVSRPWLEGAALALILAGIWVRWSAILTLGRLFTVNVAIQEDHRLVRSTSATGSAFSSSWCRSWPRFCFVSGSRSRCSSRDSDPSTWSTVGRQSASSRECTDGGARTKRWRRDLHPGGAFSHANVFSRIWSSPCHDRSVPSR